MSATIECPVIIFGMAKLMAAIAALQVTAISIRDEREFKARDGKKTIVDMVIENGQGDRIGVVVRQDQPIEFIPDDPRSTTACKTLDQIRQAYARIQVMDEVKRKGYQNVKEERLADGSIRLVVQKWR